MPRLGWNCPIRLDAQKLTQKPLRMRCLACRHGTCPNFASASVLTLRRRMRWLLPSDAMRMETEHLRRPRRRCHSDATAVQSLTQRTQREETQSSQRRGGFVSRRAAGNAEACGASTEGLKTTETRSGFWRWFHKLQSSHVKLSVPLCLCVKKQPAPNLCVLCALFAALRLRQETRDMSL